LSLRRPKLRRSGVRQGTLPSHHRLPDKIASPDTKPMAVQHKPARNAPLTAASTPRPMRVSRLAGDVLFCRWSRSCRRADDDWLRSPAKQRAAATNCGRRHSSRRDWFGVAAIVIVGPRPCVAASRGDPHDTGRVPARLARERLRQIGEQVDLRERLGAVRCFRASTGRRRRTSIFVSCWRGRCRARRPSCTCRRERLLACATRLLRKPQSMTSPSRERSISAPGAHSNAGWAYGARPSDEVHHVSERHP